MRSLVSIALVGLTLLFSMPAVCAESVALGTPHELETFVDVAECSQRLREDIREAGNPTHTSAEIWIAAWSWSNDFYMEADKTTLLEEIKNALVRNSKLKVYVLLWDMPIAANIFLKLGWSRFNDQLAVAGWSNDCRERFVISRESLLLRHPLSSAHQKFMLIQLGDDSEAYCFDYNFQNFFWDWSDHDVRRRVADGLKLPPVHDTAIRFKGLAVGDFRHEFLYRWAHSNNSKQVPNAMFRCQIDSKPLPLLQARFQHPGTKGGDIKKWYRSSLQNAHDYVYLENQFLDDSDISDDLIEAYFRGLSYPQPNIIANLCSVSILEPQSQLNGTLRQVMRIRLSTAEKIALTNGVVIRRTGQWKKVSINHNATKCTLRGASFNGSFLLSQIKQIDGGVRFYTMLTEAATSGSGAEPIYIHSKLGIIDNQLTIGSANQNKRSYGTDYEANVMVTDIAETKTIPALRDRILKVLIAPSATGATSFQKLEQTADLNSAKQLANRLSEPEGMVIHYPYCKNIRSLEKKVEKLKLRFPM